MSSNTSLSSITAEEAQYLAERVGTTRLDNSGQIAVENRAARRQKPKTEPKFTKATHSLKLSRSKSKKKARKNK